MSVDASPIQSEKRDLTRGALQILGGSGIRILARILLLTFVARMYGIEDFGRLGETVALVELLATLATFGLSKTLIGKLSESESSDDNGKDIANALALAGTLSVAIAGILWIGWSAIASPELAGSQFVLLGIPLIALAEVATTATRHHRTAFWDMLVKALVKPWSFLALSVMVYYGIVKGQWVPIDVSSEQALLMAYVGSLTLTAGAAFLALLKSFGLVLFKRSDVPIRVGALKLARRSWPIALNETGLFAFRRIDVIILAVVAGPKETAIYYMARQIGTIVEKVRHLFEPVLSPIIAQSTSLEDIGAHLSRLGFFVFSVQLLVICLFAIFGSTILSYLGSGFATGVLVVLVILLGELFDGGTGLSELPMVYRDPVWPPRMVLTTVIIEVVLVWVLAQQFGALGAAIGFAASMFVLSVMRLLMVRRLYGFSVLNLAQPFMLSAALIVVVISQTQA